VYKLISYYYRTTPNIRAISIPYTGIDLVDILIYIYVQFILHYHPIKQTKTTDVTC